MDRRQFIQGLLLFGATSLTVELTAAGADQADLLREAIRRRRSVHLRYGGHLRIVDPHALGVTVGGHRALLAWQIEGGSRSDPPTGWRTFLLSEITEATATGRSFTPRSDYHPERANLRDIEVEVAREP